MIEQRTDARTQEQIWQQAADWLLRLNQSPECPTLTAEHLAWLQQSPAHAKAYQQTLRAWGLSAQLNTTPSRSSSPPRKRAAPAWAKVAGLAILMLLSSSLWNSQTADLSTAKGQHQQVQLEDGSQLYLASESAIDLHFTPQQRQLTLQQGSLFIEVVSERTRPFMINAGAVQILVTGTAFEVQHSPTSTQVSVAHGSVDISHRQSQHRVQLQVGEQLQIDHNSEQWVTLPHAAEQIAPWRDWQLLVHNQPLESVVQQLQPYQQGWIVLRDTKLSQRRVTASLDLRNPLNALQAVLEPLDASVESFGPLLLVEQKPSQAAQ